MASVAIGTYQSHAAFARQHLQALATAVEAGRERPARRRARRRHQDPGDAVRHGVTARRRRLRLEGIENPAGDHFVVLTQAPEVPDRVFVEGVEITADEDQAARAGDAAHAQQRLGQRRRRRYCAARHARPRQPPEHAQHPAAASRRTHLVMFVLGEDHGTDAVRVRRRGPRERCRRLRRDDGLERHARAEEHAGAEIDDDEDRSLPLFTINLGVRRTAARGHTPVDAADVVAGKVQTRLVEIHAATAKARDVTPGQGRARSALRPRREPVRLKPQGEQLLDIDLGTTRHRRLPCPPRSDRRIHGTATRLSSSAMKPSASMPSASASNDISTR